MRRCLAASSKLVWRRCRLAGRASRPSILHTILETHSARLSTSARIATSGPGSYVDSSERPSAHQADGQSKSDSFLSRLNALLPGRFRGSDALEASEGHDADAVALGELLLEGLTDKQAPIDVLYDLAVVKGKWKAAVWMANQLLQSASMLQSRDTIESSLILRDLSIPQIDDIVQSTNRNMTEILCQRQVNKEIASLDALTEVTTSPDHSHHQMLGCIWRSLGMMTLACVRDKSIANGGMRPEILEILALFHHYGLMPDAVYTYRPNDRLGAVQQPATLFLLSSRFMLALSDAAWRAHEAETLETTKDLSSNRLERLGSSVRANIEVVKPEMWLELILWSSLRGGWTQAGMEILYAVSQETSPEWRPISWRSILRDQLNIERTADVNWDELLASFSMTRKDSHDPISVQLDHTVSSELVNAYVEACIDLAVDSSEEDVLASRQLPQYLQAYRQFLKRSDLNLHSGTWEATILRLIDGSIATVNDIDMMSKLIEITPLMGDELTSRSEQTKPEYILDATAAILGVLHSSLQAQIDRGSLYGALRAYRLIWQCVDNAQARSIEDFFRSRVLSDQTASTTGDTEPFTSNVRLEYPTFESQIPPTTSAAFLDLVVQRDAFNLIGPAVRQDAAYSFVPPVSQWGDPILVASLARFANARKDEELLQKVLRERDRVLATSSEKKENALLGSNINATLLESLTTMNWSQASSILRYIESQDKLTFDAQCLSALGAIVLKTRAQQDIVNEVEARELLRRMTTERMLRVEPGDVPAYEEPRRNVLKVLSLFDRRIAQMSSSQKAHTSLYAPDAECMNIILDAVATTRGSYQANFLLRSLMPARAPKAEDPASKPILDALNTPIAIRATSRPKLTSYLVVLRQMMAELRDENGSITAIEGHDRDRVRFFLRIMLQSTRPYIRNWTMWKAEKLLAQELQGERNGKELIVLMHEQSKVSERFTDDAQDLVEGRIDMTQNDAVNHTSTF